MKPLFKHHLSSQPSHEKKKSQFWSAFCVMVKCQALSCLHRFFDNKTMEAHDENRPWWETTPFFKTAFHWTCQFTLPCNEYLTKDHLSLKTTFVWLLGQFSSLTDWVVWRSGRTIQQWSSSSLFCRRPLWAVLARAGIPTLWRCPSSVSSADHGVVHSPRRSEGSFWRHCCGMWHAWTMQVSISWQLPEQVPVDPLGSWSCSTPTH